MNPGIENAEYVYGIPYENLPTYKAKPYVGDKPTEVSEGINYELLDEIYSFIKAHPLTWRQESWYKYVDVSTGDTKMYATTEEVTDPNVCGTAFCFAGHVAIKEGFPSPPKESWYKWSRSYVASDEQGEYDEEAYEFATKRLGLDQDVADVLFDAGNTLDDLGKIIDALKKYPDIEADILEEFIRYNDDDLTLEEFLSGRTAVAA